MEITVLTQEGCDFCALAEEILEKLAADFSFSISVVDLASRAGQDLARRGGILFPPGILLDGEPFSFGRPSERRLRRELGRLLGAPAVGQ
jgi:glutaredoxin